MKKTFLLIAACVVTMAASAQIFTIESTQKIPTPQGTEWKVAGFSPVGDYILITDDANSGLVRMDLATKATQVISQAPGAGWAVQISKDGQNIVYREMTIGEDKLVRHDIFRQNMATNKREAQATAQRDMTNLVDKVAKQTVAINEDLHMVITRNGKTIVVTPNGAEEAYNWASISPDGKKILYYVSAKGCYVCDMNGQNVQFVARHCRAPQWYDNNTIVGMADEDDGTFMTASAIVAYTLDGKSQVLVNKENMAIYPYAAKGQIAFSNAGGEVFLMNVK
jgi:Tol biopolymer transport system component